MTKIYHGDTKGRPFRIVAYKCDLCANTETGEPACIPACPTEALSLFDPAVVAAQRAKLKAQKEAAKTQAAYEKALKKESHNHGNRYDYRSKAPSRRRLAFL